MQRTHGSRLGIVVVFAMVAAMFAAVTGTALASAGTHAKASAHKLKDSDGDGLPNRWERAHHTNHTAATPRPIRTRTRCGTSASTATGRGRTPRTPTVTGCSTGPR